MKNWKQKLETERGEKDQFFALHPQSPLPQSDREDFTALDYFPPDPKYRFELMPHEYKNQELIHVADTRGQQRGLLVWGEFQFQVGDLTCSLQAYRSDAREERLFLPFKDETNDEQTYGAGRYMDLEPEHHLTDNGLWVVDFNEAYNPWCAYSKHYACPFVPRDNWLPCPVHAGEKKYPLNDK
ncbi:MAG: DUF1684 domain-containing protein [Planctomycetes bacterium]|nr:DUF1684 domain-containing protein [Planctomycetota bacterium]